MKPNFLNAIYQMVEGQKSMGIATTKWRLELNNALTSLLATQP